MEAVDEGIQFFVGTLKGFIGRCRFGVDLFKRCDQWTVDHGHGSGRRRWRACVDLVEETREDNIVVDVGVFGERKVGWQCVGVECKRFLDLAAREVQCQINSGKFVSTLFAHRPSLVRDKRGHPLTGFLDGWQHGLAHIKSARLIGCPVPRTIDDHGSLGGNKLIFHALCLRTGSDNTVLEFQIKQPLKGIRGAR